MRCMALALVLLSLSACVLRKEYPEIPEPQPPPPAVVEAPLPAPPSPDPIPEIVWPAQPSFPPSITPMAPPPSKQGRAVRPPNERPDQVIREAQQAARVAPSRMGYFGQSGVQRYIWTPGKLYDVYLAPGSGTKLTLPPGEILAHALILNPKSFDVMSATVGNDVNEASIMLIRPCAATEEACVPATETDVAVTSKSGRGYNLHLIIGKVGMVEVTWELTPILHMETTEPGMLPKKQP